jgi:hypothetical protein
MRRIPTRFLVAAFLIPCAGSVLAGAWGTGSFENDDALDWAREFEAKPGMNALVSTLEATGSGYLEAPEGSAAVAAAEVVAAMAGKPSATLPAGLGAWARKQPRAEALAQLPLARRAVDRVARGESSELRELWHASDAAAWQKSIAELEARLSP